MPMTRYPSLHGRAVLVTGGATGIGAAFVEHFARQGAKVVFLDIDDGGAQALLASLTNVENLPHYLHCDITDIAAFQETIAEGRRKVGAFSVLVNNAANDARHALADTGVADFERSVAVNLRHQYFAIQAVVPDMKSFFFVSLICVFYTFCFIKYFVFQSF